jgi:beta-phosphoglucomutase
MSARSPVGWVYRRVMSTGLIFDMDGVLFDSHPIHRKVWRELLLCMGKVVPDEELDFIMDGARREEILFHFLGALTPEQARICSEQKDARFKKEEDHLRTVPGLEAFLDLAEAAGIPKAVATCASGERTRRMLRQHGLISRFTSIVTGDDVTQGKSDPAIFLRSAEELGVPPRDVLVVEDAVPAIKAAKSVGMKCLGIATGARVSQLLQAGADLVVTDFRQLCLFDVERVFYPQGLAHCVPWKDVF